MPIIAFILGAGALFLIGTTILWFLTDFNTALRYSYIATGAATAVAYYWQVIGNIRREGTTIHERLVQSVGSANVLSSPAAIFKVAVYFIKEGMIRLTYWPVELGLANKGLAFTQAATLGQRSAIGTDVINRMPLMTATAMLAINLVLFLLQYFFAIEGRTTAFGYTVLLSLVATIIWLLDCLVNPIEIQLRMRGSPREVFLRFAYVCFTTLVSLVILILTYRRLTQSEAGVLSVGLDVLLAGKNNPELGQLLSDVWSALTDWELGQALARIRATDAGLATSLLACGLFYATIGRRVLASVTSHSLFYRTPAESLVAAMTLANIGAFDEAKPYADELSEHHPVRSVIDIRKALAAREFETARGMTERFVNRRRRDIGIEGDVHLDDRERWFILMAMVFEIPDGAMQLEFAKWSAHQVFTRTQDIAKMLATQMMYGGITRVATFAHYLDLLLAESGEGVTASKLEVVKRFLIPNWETLGGDTERESNFENRLIAATVGACQTEKALLFLNSSNLFRTIPELDERAFGRYVSPDLPRFLTDVGSLASLTGLDRFYVQDLLFTVGKLASAEEATALRAAADQLMHAWGESAFDRFGLSTKLMTAVGDALPALLH